MSSNHRLIRFEPALCIRISVVRLQSKTEQLKARQDIADESLAKVEEKVKNGVDEVATLKDRVFKAETQAFMAMESVRFLQAQMAEWRNSSDVQSKTGESSTSAAKDYSDRTRLS